MTMDQERESLVTFRFHQADEMVKLVEFLMSADKLGLAVTRIYYGMFYALNALATQQGMDTSNHRKLLRWFTSEYVARGKADPLLGKILRNAYQNMLRADHDPFVRFAPLQVENMHAELIQFKDEIKKLIGQ
ncbi:MAG: hypothetical protein U0T82_16810 [Bacteroidales bacterium]